MNPNWLLVIKCFFSKWSQAICLIGDWHSPQWFAMPRIHPKPLHATYPPRKLGTLFQILNSQDYRHWSYLRVLQMSSDVIFEPRPKSPLKELPTDFAPLRLTVHSLSKLCSFYRCHLKIISSTTDFDWGSSNSFISLLVSVLPSSLKSEFTPLLLLFFWI